MSNVTIERNQKNPPSEAIIRKAMGQVGGVVSSVVDRGGSSKSVTFTGTVNRTTFQNALEKEGKGNKQSWNFVWADA